MGAVLILPFFVSLLAREFGYSSIFGGLGFGLFLGGYLVTKRLKPHQTLELKEALVVTAFSYLLFALVGALPFLAQVSFLNGLFEALSGFTTTGLTVVDVTQLPKTLLFFRAYSQWIGGAGIIVLSLAILLRSGGAALRLYASESRQENIMGSVIATARVVLRVYLILTAVTFVAFWVARMSPFEALLHALSTISTGGFSPFPDSIGHYQSTAIHLVTVLFMWMGATSFPLWHRARREGIRRFTSDGQFRYLLLFSGLGCLVFFLSFGPFVRSIAPGLFQSVSALTTTGFNTVSQSGLSAGAKLATIVLMIIGGATGSTAGGIKLFRLIVLFSVLRWLLLRPLLPEGATVPVKYGETEIDSQGLRFIAGFALLYLLVLILAALILMFSGYGFADSLFEAASAQGTVGLSVGVTSPTMPTVAKLVLMLEMWVGRLEIVPVAVALYPGIWFARRKRKYRD